jgi:glycosyltransferase involved in cell wall biosynthesis
MSVGTRVVATNVGGLPYLLADGGGILVEAKDANALANGLEQALRSESSLFKPENAQQKVSENSFDTILNRLLQIYRSAEKSEGVHHE